MSLKTQKSPSHLASDDEFEVAWDCLQSVKYNFVGVIVNNNELILLQNYPLWMKVEKTKRRIEEWYEYWQGEVYISFSGGKDSTVLLHIAREMYPDIEAVYVDTGLEYPEVKEFIKTFENVTIIRPEMSFKEVITKYGYPIISKENSQYLYDIRTGTNYMKERRLNGDSKGRFKLPKKYHYLMDSKFPISHMCCQIMKKDPVKKYEKTTGKKPMVGVMAQESNLRKQSYMKSGCNAFNNKRPLSTPLGFWKQEDILEYIFENKIKIASVYGEVLKEEEKTLIETIISYKTTKCDRTGCIYCAYGANQKGDERFIRLKKTHPQLHEYCMNNLGMKEVLEYINVKYE